MCRAQSLQLQTGCWEEFGPSNYLKGCKWCYSALPPVSITSSPCSRCRAPDGTCLLVCSADCKMRIFNLPSELYSGPIQEQLPDMVRMLNVVCVDVWISMCVHIESSADTCSWRDYI